MRKSLKSLKRLLFVAVGLMAFASGAQAQMDPTQSLPADPQLRYGTLPNGMTYYIRHNETPKGQADFYIAQKVGSMLENDDQRGLAHFLEHMCFNGTENFEGNEVVKWLETKGVKFGRDLNAYTAFDETVYNIANVPSANTAVTDSCLLILHDWADGLLLLPEEIDKERGVIHEEWRSRNSGQQRLMEVLLPKIFPGTKYGLRMPIGTMEVVDNFPPEALRAYYEEWYRPDQQGLVIVGDLDVDRTEAKIKEIFEPIKMPENAPERVYEPVPDNEGMLVAVGADPEVTNSVAMMAFKTDPVPREMRNTMPGMMMKYVMEMASSMFNARLDEMRSNPETPFSDAGGYYGNFLVTPTKDAFTIQVSGKGNDLRPALASVYREVLRAAKGGFTATEYDRARSEYLSRLEKNKNNIDKTDNSAYVNRFVRGFIDGTPTIDADVRYQIMSAVAPQIPVELINQTMSQLITPDNRALLVMAPEKEGIVVPTEEQLVQTISEVDGETIEAFVDEVKAEPLIPTLPTPGTITATKELPQWGATQWTLSNGVKVVFKKTDFKADEIVFDAQALGGTSVFPDSYANSLLFSSIVSEMGGLGDYTNKDLSKYLQGKQASVGVEFDDYIRDVSGSTTPKDLPTLMELIYMTFTAPNITVEEFTAAQQSISDMLKHQDANPMYVFQKSVNKALYANPRKQTLTSDKVKAATREQCLEIYQKMTANAADYTFFFVGSIDEATFKPLVEQYIATLPANAATATTAPKFDASLALKASQPVQGFKTPMQTPTTYVAIIESGKLDYTPKEKAALETAAQILSQRLIEKVREDMGAVYSINASGNMRRLAQADNSIIQSVFPVKPEMTDQVLQLIADEFKAMESNVTPQELGKVTEYTLKAIAEEREKNAPWLNAMAGVAINGVDTFSPAEEIYKNLTVADVQEAVKALNQQGNYWTVVLEAEEAPAK